MKWGLILAAVSVVGVLIVIPVVHVFAGALSEGVRVYWDNLVADPDTRHSILLTLTVVPLALAANVVFGIAAAWAIARFRFPGRTVLTALIDLPFSVSPVVAGLMLVLIFGLQCYLGPFLRRDGYAVMPYLTSLVGAAVFVGAVFLFRPRGPQARAIWKRSGSLALIGGGAAFAVLLAVQLSLDVWPHDQSLKIIFATPGLVLATAVVTFPFVARELIRSWRPSAPTRRRRPSASAPADGRCSGAHRAQHQGAWPTGSSSATRAMGEFGAVYVVPATSRDRPTPCPLRVEKLFQEYNLPGSFAVASVLTLLAIGPCWSRPGWSRAPRRRAVSIEARGGPRPSRSSR